jgi:glucose-6-phosphate isomerase
MFLTMHQGEMQTIRTEIKQIRGAHKAVSEEDTKGRWEFRKMLVQMLIGGSGAGAMLLLQKLLG